MEMNYKKVIEIKVYRNKVDECEGLRIVLAT